MNTINCDILDIDSLPSNNKIIVHAVNCQGVMGGGLAKQIREKYPQVYEDYKKYSNVQSPFDKNPAILLGSYVDTVIDDNTRIISMYTQLYFGTDQRQTDYCAVNKGFEKLLKFLWACYALKYPKLEDVDWPMVYIPWKFGCGLGGGDWDTVKKTVEYNSTFYNKCVWCKL